MEHQGYTLTIKGNTIGEVLEKARALIDEAPKLEATAATLKGKKIKTSKTPMVTEVDEDQSMVDDYEADHAGEDEDTELSFDEENEDVEDEPAPKAKAKTAKAPTTADVQSALKAFVAANPKDGRSKALAVLAKFGVKTVAELKAGKYQAVIDALKMKKK